MNKPLLSATETSSGVSDARDYHQRTKHHFSGYAKGPETIDWDNQPNPFRRYDGAPLVELPFVADQLSVSYAQLTDSAAQKVAAEKVNLKWIAGWLETSLALSAWKQFGTARWSLRCNPSSGNLHPTEAYLILLGVPGVADGLYHYCVELHALELRCDFRCEEHDEATPAENSPVVYLGLSSIAWREAWKYGERAYRYCQLDIGHAVAALNYAAGLQGGSVEALPATPDAQLAQLLGVDRADDFAEVEKEYPEVLLRLNTSNLDSFEGAEKDNVETLLADVSAGKWYGKPNLLDKHPFYKWPIIDETFALCEKPEGIEIEETQTLNVYSAALASRCEESAARIIRSRRSAQAFDGQSVLAKDDFYRILDQTLPRKDFLPWSGLTGDVLVHCVLFIHRVEGFAPGLYAFPRSESGEAMMRSELRDQFLWKTLDDGPNSGQRDFPLYQLIAAKAERTASKLSCQQPIAGDGAFSLGMLGDFADVEAKPWRYRAILSEAGMIGQTLYLEAESVGMRGTGIGCFFDDGVHDLLGIQTERLQSVYHFTVGNPIIDHRLASYSPYSELKKQRGADQ
ncbi:SagB/ThcOx family dehydrogenase [Aurantivibrio plasticivorans]